MRCSHSLAYFLLRVVYFSSKKHHLNVFSHPALKRILKEAKRKNISIKKWNFSFRGLKKIFHCSFLLLSAANIMKIRKEKNMKELK